MLKILKFEPQISAFRHLMRVPELTQKTRKLVASRTDLLVISEADFEPVFGPAGARVQWAKNRPKSVVLDLKFEPDPEPWIEPEPVENPPKLRWIPPKKRV